MNSHETQQLYQKYVKHTICISNYQLKLESNSRTHLNHKTLGKFKPKLTQQQSTTAIFAVLNSFIIKRLSTKSKDDKTDSVGLQCQNH